MRDNIYKDAYDFTLVTKANIYADTINITTGNSKVGTSYISLLGDDTEQIN